MVIRQWQKISFDPDDVISNIKNDHKTGLGGQYGVQTDRGTEHEQGGFKMTKYGHILENQERQGESRGKRGTTRTKNERII